MTEGRNSQFWHLRSALVSSLVCALLALPIAFSITPVQAQDAARLRELQEKARQLNSEIQSNQKAAQQKKQEAASISTQIKDIEGDIETTEQKIESTQQQIETTEAEIANTQAAIDVKQQELDTQLGNQDEALRVLYETGDEELLLVLAGSDSINEIIEQNEYLQSLEDQIDAMIGEIEAFKRDLEAKRSELESKKTELAGLRAQQEAYRVGLSQEQDRKEDLLVRTKEQQKEYESAVAEAKQLNATVESEMASLRQKLSGGRGPGVIQAKDRGTSTVGFQWPTDYKYVSTYFGGSTPFQPSGGHGGLDLVNVSGTPIYAASDGTVTAVEEMTYNGKFYAYGRYIVVGHNARYSSLYAHLQSAVVSGGDEVKRGDVIGYMGSTGWSTGPHLHFEIWEYSSRVNPVNYLP
ncbi:peptidoglycan DD-metalloendopeptidase family protein [Candidatus Berkelbacteria bacterium]|nr:peptidoglycan DD-metalloendopeptidase family protein [Candidatus Berkelbacteria bacterium]